MCSESERRRTGEELMENYSVPLLSKNEGEEEEVAATNSASLTWSRTGSCGSIPFSGGQKRKQLKKQLSMRETKREAKWEKRRRQIIARQLVVVPEQAPEVEIKEAEDGDEGRSTRRVKSLTDEDLDELRACIELGFGFREEEGGCNLRHTVPALDLYFAVKRQALDLKLQLSTSPVSTPSAASSPTAVCRTPSPRSPAGSSSPSSSESWMICSPGEDPQDVKPRLIHWAQAVVCSSNRVARFHPLPTNVFDVPVPFEGTFEQEIIL